MLPRALGVLALIIGIAPAVTFAQAFEGVVTMKMQFGAEGAREPRELSYSIRQGLLRVDMPGRGDARSVMIIDQNAKTTTMLMPAQKRYMVMSFPQNVGEARPGSRPATDIVRTGRRETVAGYECEHWLIKGGEHEVDACVASGIGTFMPGGRGRDDAWAGAFRDQQGFPLKVARDGATFMEVTKIEKKPLDAALFSPPADYQKMEMPAGAAPRPRP